MKFFPLLIALLLTTFPGFAEGRPAQVTVVSDTESPQQAFGVSRLTHALEAKHRRVETHSGEVLGSGYSVTVSVLDSKDNLLKSGGFRLTNADGAITIHAIDQTGAMYGLLELAELSSQHAWAEIPSRTMNPRFPFRAIKFNTPWSSYRRHESLQLHTATVGNMEYWDGFLDMMAENRFNVLTIWSLHPFPYMIRPANFPKACEFDDAELARQQAFWRALFRRARERGIETYLVNWNIFVNRGFRENYHADILDDYSTGSHGKGAQAEIVERYHRECVTQLINEYPDLTGLGITLGEGMGGMTPTERRDWLQRTFIDGMEAADRPVKFIHRAPLSAGTSVGASTSRAVEEETREFIDALTIPRPVWTEFKFNWSHALSTPKLVQVHGGPLTDTYWNPPPQSYSINWMIRNEDVFVLRWGQPDFIREHIARNGQDYVGGYYVGSETYIPGADYLHLREHPHVNWKHAWERQWLFYMQWGRLLYDPQTPDAVFAAAFDQRYGAGVGAALTEATKLASNMPLRFASFVRSTWDATIYSEGFLAPRAVFGRDDGHSPFLSIGELVNWPVLDPVYLNIKDYVASVATGPLPPDRVSPLSLADELQQLSERALALVLPIKTGHGPLECEVHDIRAWSHFGLYFAAKLRAGVALETYANTRAPTEKTRAIALLREARQHWQNIVAVTKDHHRAIPLLHTGEKPFSWELYLPEIERDIQIAESY